MISKSGLLPFGCDAETTGLGGPKMAFHEVPRITPSKSSLGKLRAGHGAKSTPPAKRRPRKPHERISRLVGEVLSSIRRTIAGDNNPSHHQSDRTTAKTGSVQTLTAVLNLRRLVPVEVRIVAEKEEAFQSFGLEQHFAGYPLSFDPEKIDEPVNGPDNVAVHHLVASYLLDIASDGFGK